MPNPDGTMTPEEAAALGQTAQAFPSLTGDPMVDAELARVAAAQAPTPSPAFPGAPVQPAIDLGPPVGAADRGVPPVPQVAASQVIPSPFPQTAAPAPQLTQPKMTIPTPAGVADFGSFAPMERQVGAERSALAGLAQAESEKAAAVSDKMLDQARMLTERQNSDAEALAEINTQADKLRQDIMDHKIDPQRLWNERSGAQQAGSLIGILLSGVGSGLTGQPNLALQVMDKMIERDINAQTANLGKKENALSHLMQKYGNVQHAQQALRISMAEVAKLNLDAAVAKMDAGVAQQRGMVLSAEAGRTLAGMKTDFAQKIGFFNFTLRMMDQVGGGAKDVSYGAGNQPVPEAMTPEGMLKAKRQAQLQTFHLPNGQAALATSPAAAEDAKPIVRAATAFQEVLARLRSGKLGPVEMSRATSAAQAELAILIGNGKATSETQDQAAAIVGGWKSRWAEGAGVDPYSEAERLAHDRVNATVRAATGDGPKVSTPFKPVK
jgi:hypothetical protein